MREINERFEHGTPSNDPATVGVIVRQFDGLDDVIHGRPWLPCARGVWCSKYADRWAASVINLNVRTLYYAGSATGVVLAPNVRLLCAYSEDGNSMAETKVCPPSPPGGGGVTCIPGCSPAGKQCHEVAVTSWDVCSYPPDRLEDALKAQQQVGRDRGSFRNNEVVIDALHMKSRLPEGIAGFFYMSGTSEHDRQSLKQWHKRFIEEYGFPPQHNPPLMELSLESGGSQPFRLVAMERKWSAGDG